MKQTLLLCGLLLIHYGCSHEKENKVSGDINTEDSLKTDSTSQNIVQETFSPYQLELNNALADPSIDNYYKEIYKQVKLIIADDEKMVSITDSLFIKNSDKDLFYFIVFTKSMNGADGFFSEAISNSALKFIRTRTEQFADYFNIAPNLSEKDLDNWASFVSGEIQISNEGEETKAIKELELQLLGNIEGARKEYKFVVKNLIEKIKSTMP